MSRSKTKTTKKKKVQYALSESPLLPSFVSTDAGNGGWEVARLNNDRVESHSQPHGRVEVSAKKLGGDNLIGQVKFDYTEWQGKTYAVGDNLHAVTRSAIDDNRNFENRYGSDHHLFGIFNGIARMKVSPDEPLTLIVPMPPGLMRDGRDKDVKRAIMSGETGQRDGKWTVAINGKKPVEYTVERVIVPPEGVEAYAAYVFDLNGNFIDNEEVYDEHGRYLFGGHTVVFDLGYGTGDRVDITAGSLRSEDMIHATRSDAGIQYHLVMPILKKLKEDLGANHLTENHVDGWLRQWAIGGFTEEAAEFEVSGKLVNAFKLFSNHCHQYAQWFATNMLQAAFRDGADTILTAGGGWMFIEQLVMQAFPDRVILAPYMFSHLKTVPVFSLNSYGGLALLAQNMRIHA